MVRTVTGKGIDPKRLAAYLKRSQKIYDISVQRHKDTLFITNGFLFVRLSLADELAAWTPKQEQTVKYATGAATPVPIEGNYAATWEKFTSADARACLSPTHLLYDNVPTLYRKFTFTRDKQEQAIWIDKALTDLFATDPDDFYGYIVELITKDTVRIGAYNGWCACVVQNADIRG